MRLAAIDSADLLISFPASGDQVTVVGALANGALPSFLFSDGVAWDGEALVQRAIRDQSSAGDNIILGSDRADSLEGGRGDDQLRGGGGNDAYRFARGDGHDVLEDSGGSDTLKISGYSLEELIVSKVAADRDELVLRFDGGEDSLLLRYGSDRNGIDWLEFGDGRRIGRDDLFQRVTTKGGAADDILRGSGANETFNGGGANDDLSGGGGTDTFAFSRGDGQDRIEGGGGFGVLRFGAGIGRADLILSRDRDGALSLAIAGTDDRVTIAAPAHGQDPAVAQVRFADGSVLSYADLALSLAATAGDDHLLGRTAGSTKGVELDGGAGNDWLEGGAGGDILFAGKGDDHLEGASGADTYVFARGDGQDVILDLGGNSAAERDRVRFGAGINPADIKVIAIGPTDLVIGLAGSDDRLTLKNMVVSAWSPQDYGIEEFAFANGTIWSLSDILSPAATGSDADDRIDFGGNLSYPGAPATTLSLDGGRGDDWLSGGPGDSTYRFERGDGRDTIWEGSAWWWNSSDSVAFGSGIAPGDLVVEQAGGDLILYLRGADDRLTITGQTSAEHAPIDSVRFADGTVWTAAELAARALGRDATQRELHPASDNSEPFLPPLFVGASGPGSGDGSRSGAEPGEINAGFGPRLLTGTAGRDTYHLFVPLSSLDDAVTTITDFQVGDGGDILDIRLAEGLSGEIMARQEGADTYVYFAAYGIATLDQARLLLRLPNIGATAMTGGNFNGSPFARTTNLTLTGTNTAETLSGSWGNDTLRGRDGNDTLIGGPGADNLVGEGNNDTYRFALGFGQDTVAENSWYSSNDVIEFGAGIAAADLIVEQSRDGRSLILEFAGSDDRITISEALVDDWNRIETVRFADGTSHSYADLVLRSLQATNGDDSRYGSYTNDILLGGAGNDTLYGGGGTDTLDGGIGNDELKGGVGGDTYRFALGFGQDSVFDIDYSWQSFDDVIEFGAGISAATLIVEQSSDGRSLILKFAESDERVTISQAMDSAYSSIETVRFADGTSLSHADLVLQSIQATSGDDSRYGSYTNDILMGGAGNDTLYGGDGTDTLDGGIGNDELQGGVGGDTYRFALGFGQDSVVDNGWSYYSYNDVIEFGAGISAADLIVEQSADGRALVLKFAGTDDRVTIVDTMVNDYNRVETVRFEDGTSLSHADLVLRSMQVRGGDDNRYGSYDDDILLGGAGNDSLHGRDGTDTLDGGKGNDNLAGEGNNDTYRFELGFGQDSVADNGWSFYSDNSDNDVIEFGAGISAADLIVEQSADGWALVLKFAGTDDRVTIVETMVNDYNRIETVRFADGTSLSHADLLQRSIPAAGADVSLVGSDTNDSLFGGEGNDSLDGLDGTDTLEGGLGNDVLRGGGDSDIYRFELGFGQDSVVDNGWSYSSWYDVIEFGAGIAAADLVVEQSRDGWSLILKFASSDDRITIVDALINDWNRIEAVYFADGTSLSEAELFTLSAFATDGDDSRYGSSGNDVLWGLDRQRHPGWPRGYGQPRWRPWQRPAARRWRGRHLPL